MPIEPKDLKNAGAVGAAVAKDQSKESTGSSDGMLRTSLMVDPNPNKSLTTYTVGDIVTGATIGKPSGVTFDTFNTELSKELEGISAEKLYTPDKRINPYDVFKGGESKKFDATALGGFAPSMGDPNAAVAAGASSTPPANGTPSGVTPIDVNSAKGMGWVFPLTKYDEPGGSGWYGPRTPPVPGASSWHKGLDLSIIKGGGDPILAVADGQAYILPNNGGAGNTVRIDHKNGLWTQYFHCARFIITNNIAVTKGQQIAIVGMTGIGSGAHLHFQVHQVPAGGTPSGGSGSNTGNSVDPAPYILGFPSKKNN